MIDHFNNDYQKKPLIIYLLYKFAKNSKLHNEVKFVINEGFKFIENSKNPFFSSKDENIIIKKFKDL